jgi:hypothetical protein
MALDKATGKVIWDKLAFESEPKIARHPHSSYAAATPATDGKHIARFSAPKVSICTTPPASCCGKSTSARSIKARSTCPITSGATPVRP